MASVERDNEPGLRWRRKRHVTEDPSVEIMTKMAGKKKKTGGIYNKESVTLAIRAKTHLSAAIINIT